MTLGTIAVTGAAGALGTVICQRLKDRGDRIAALIRAGDPQEALRPYVNRIVVGSVDDERSAEEALKGADALVNCAALLPSVLSQGRHAFERANVRGPETLLRTMQRLGIRKGVFVSTIGVIDHTLPTTRADLYRYRTGAMDHYVATKIEAEQFLIKNAGPTDITLVRPAFIYGPTCLASWSEIITAVKRGRMLVIGSGEARFPLVYSTDLADYIIDLLQAPHRGGSARVVIASDPNPVTTMSLFTSMSAYYGRSPPKRVPTWVAYPLAAVAERLPPPFRLGPLKLLTKRRVREYSIGYDLGPALGDDAFGFRLQTPLKKGLKAMLDAFEGRRP